MIKNATCVPVQLQKEPKVSTVVVMVHARPHVLRSHVLRLDVDVIQVGQDPNAKFTVGFIQALSLSSIWQFYLL